ncbi:hypothetical protein [Dactylosporangium sp. NPDC051541]|uniref:hypothetical protein n=1 Tax=Dactylosporangium sp. NPDC051541 TaxID=3363977 RepID=UPI0037BA7695
MKLSDAAAPTLPPAGAAHQCAVQRQVLSDRSSDLVIGSESVSDSTGAQVSALINQIHRLEHDIGATLINRGTVTTPMTPTTRGAQLLQALGRPDIHALVEHHGQPPHGWKPDEPRRSQLRTGRQCRS